MMEKNGAISSNTPCDKNCNCTKKASDRLGTQQYTAYPTTSQQADVIDTDTLKQATELVKDAFKPSK